MGRKDRNRSSIDFSMPGGAGDQMYTSIAKETLAYGESHMCALFLTLRLIQRY